MEGTDFKKLKELRNELQLRGLDTSGTKQVLLERLEGTVTVMAPEPAALDLGGAAQPRTEEEPAPTVTALAAETEAKAAAPTTEEEKRKLRAERFGIPVVAASVDKGPGEPDKKTARAARFGMVDSGVEQSRKVARAARRVPACMLEKCAGGAPLRARFGAPSGVAEDTKRPAEAAPVDPEFEAKKAKRAERFK